MKTKILIVDDLTEKILALTLLIECLKAGCARTSNKPIAKCDLIDSLLEVLA